MFVWPLGLPASLLWWVIDVRFGVSSLWWYKVDWDLAGHQFVEFCMKIISCVIFPLLLSLLIDKIATRFVEILQRPIRRHRFCWRKVMFLIKNMNGTIFVFNGVSFYITHWNAWGQLHLYIYFNEHNQIENDFCEMISDNDWPSGG